MFVVSSTSTKELLFLAKHTQEVFTLETFSFLIKGKYYRECGDIQSMYFIVQLNLFAFVYLCRYIHLKYTAV